VSTRTFHNYFPRREDALLTFIEFTVDELTALIAEAPADEAPLTTLRRVIGDRVADNGDGTAEGPGSLLNLIAIGDHLSYVTGPEDKDRVRSLFDDLLDALYRRDGNRLSRQGTALLLLACLAAGGIAVEAAQSANPEDTSGHLLPWMMRDESPRGAVEVLDEGFALLREGFGG
jgi:AcrR family transcriptional regulator